VVVNADIVDKLAEFFTDRQIVEIVATVAAYNMVTRFIVALDVQDGNLPA
jgi:4-carboxymuconolactone decarboxylase